MRRILRILCSVGSVSICGARPVGVARLGSVLVSSSSTSSDATSSALGLLLSFAANHVTEIQMYLHSCLEVIGVIGSVFVW